MNCSCGLPILPGCGTCIDHINDIRIRHRLPPTTTRELNDHYEDNKRRRQMDERRIRVYIAGPMTNGTGGSYNMLKIKESVEAYLTLIQLGFVPHCPQLTVFAEFLHPGQISYTQWLTLDRCYIDDTDVVLRLEGDSVGADMECAYAKSVNTPVIYGLGNFLVHYKDAPV